jgi:serine/threonine-protein kinase
MGIDVTGLRERLAAAVGESLQVGEVLGTGGFAAVFRAHDPFLRRDVAIKVIDTGGGVSDDVEDQFLNEARVVAGVEHPHIVPLYAAESKDGLLYLVMRLLPGQSLADRLRAEGPLPFAEAARLAHEVSMALAAAHARGVVHRDIKPENILLDAAGHATVTDFGIALVTARSPDESSGLSSGTPHFMAPEQGLGEAVDGRADVYSLGVVLFRMLTARLPFEAGNLTELLATQLAREAPPVTTLRPDTPAALVASVARMLSKDKSARPDSAEAARLLASAGTPDALLTPAQVKRKRWRRRMVLMGVAGTGAGIVLVTGIYFAWQLAKAFMLADQGAPPVLSATGADIPDSVIAAARADGLLRPDETVIYAFIPGGGRMSDALLLTDSALIRRSLENGRRIPFNDGTIHLNRRASSGVIHGSAIFERESLPPDTIYASLSSLDVIALLAAMQLVPAPSDTAR